MNRVKKKVNVDSNKKKFYPKCLNHNSVTQKKAFTAPFSEVYEATNNYDSLCSDLEINIDDALIKELTESAMMTNTCIANRDIAYDVCKFCNICEFNKKGYHSLIINEIKLLNYLLLPERREKILNKLSIDLFSYYYLEEIGNCYAEIFITKAIYEGIMSCDNKEDAESVAISMLKELKDSHPGIKELLSPITNKFNSKMNIDKVIDKLESPNLTIYSADDAEDLMVVSNQVLSETNEAVVITDKIDNSNQLVDDIDAINQGSNDNETCDANFEEIMSLFNEPLTTVDESTEQITQTDAQITTDSEPTEQVLQPTVPKSTTEENKKQDKQTKEPTNSPSNRGYSIDLLTELTSKTNKDNNNIELEKTTNILATYFNSNQAAIDNKDEIPVSNKDESSTLVTTSPLSSYNMSIRELEDIKNEEDALQLIIKLKHKEVFIKTGQKVEMLVMNNNAIPVKYILNLDNDAILYFLDLLFHNFSITKFVDDLKFFKKYIYLNESRSIYDINTFQLFFGVTTGQIYDLLNKRQIEAMSKENRRILKLETQLTIVKIFHTTHVSNYILNDIPEQITTDEILINAIDNRLFNKYNIKFVSGGATEIAFYIPGKDKQVTDQLIMKLEKLKRVRKIQKGIKVRWRIVDTDR